MNSTYSVENRLSGRYIAHNKLDVLDTFYATIFELKTIGYSVNKLPIKAYVIGSGAKRILIWSQMHGNETTTTKVIYDFLKTLSEHPDDYKSILEECTLVILPMLNPDGALQYTRFNANQIDLNRDAQNLSQPESKVLSSIFKDFKPHYCFNLHGQRTIFSAGYSANSSVMSFLSPAENKQRSVTPSRKKAMELIAYLANHLQEDLPNQIARYDDTFNINCVGDTFQSLKVPTILFEAGHYPNDYSRDQVRKYTFKSFVLALNYLAQNEPTGANYEPYFKIPENQKLFSDVLIRNVKLNDEIVDIAIQYQEELIEEKVVFKPMLHKIGDLREQFGHQEIDGNLKSIRINKSDKIDEKLGIIDEITIDGEDILKKISII